MTQPEEIATLLHWIKGRDAAFSFLYNHATL